MEMSSEGYRKELDLYRTKWFDYRDASPQSCDLLFLYAWVCAHNRFMEEYKLDVHLDDKGNEYLRPIRWASACELLQDTGFVAKLAHIRRFADWNCIEYQRFWSIAFEVLAEIDEWRSEVDTVSANAFVKSSILETHQERAAECIPKSNNPRMLACNWKGDQGQRDYFAYLETEVKKRYPNSWQEKLKALAESGKFVYVNQAVN